MNGKDECTQQGDEELCWPKYTPTDPGPKCLSLSVASWPTAFQSALTALGTADPTLDENFGGSDPCGASSAMDLVVSMDLVGDVQPASYLAGHAIVFNEGYQQVFLVESLRSTHIHASSDKRSIQY